jgi:small subunit ribosomal protein S19e
MWPAHRPCRSAPFFLPLPAAAIARRVYIRQGMGVGGFRRAFGGRSNAAGSTAPEHHAKAAGGIIRHALQQLEAMGLVEKNPASQGGRRITAEGQRQVRSAVQGMAAAPPAAAAAAHGCSCTRQ